MNGLTVNLHLLMVRVIQIMGLTVVEELFNIFDRKTETHFEI